MVTQQKDFKIPARPQVLPQAPLIPSSPQLGTILRSTSTSHGSPVSNSTIPNTFPSGCKPSKSSGYLALPPNPSHPRARSGSSGSATSDTSDSLKFISLDGSKVYLSGLKTAGTAFKTLGQHIPGKLSKFGED